MKLFFGSQKAVNDTQKTFKIATRALALSGALLGIAAATGCSTTPEQPAHGTVDVSPEAVTVDNYQGGTKVSGCSGTLLSANVVLTAAHCVNDAAGIRVRAPNAAGQTAEVSRVMFYDWGFGAGPASEHDVALLLLRTDIKASSYARLDDSAALRAPVTVGGRFVSDGHVATTTSTVVSVSGAAAAGRPFALTLQSQPQGAAVGGAVRRTDGSLVGVYMGEGAKTGTGYMARLDDGNIVRWVSGIVAAKGGKLAMAPYAGGSLVQTTSIAGGPALRNTGGTTGGNTTGTGDGTTAGNDNGTGDPSEDVDPSKNDTEQKDDGTDDDGEKAPSDLDSDGRPVSSNSPTAQVSSGPNHWAAFEKGDPAAAGDPDKAYAEAHPDVAEVGSHGAPGYMANRPDADTLKMIAKDKDGMVVAACYAGANPKGGGQSTAASLAADSGLSPDKVYGCTGTMSLGSSADCNGKWVDGNGKAVDPAVMKKLNLKNAA